MTISNLHNLHPLPRKSDKSEYQSNNKQTEVSSYCVSNFACKPVEWTKVAFSLQRKFEELIKKVGEEEIRKTMEEQEKQNELNYKTCYDPNNIHYSTIVTAETGIEMSWAVPFK